VRLFVVSLGSLACAACSGVFAKDDGRAFGDDLGRFHIAAVLDSTTCGANALGAPDNWQFDVVLSRDKSRFFWNTNENAVEGTVDDQGRFSLEAENVVNTGGSDAKNACVIVRTDVAKGTFDDPTAARAFDGSLEYTFAPQGTVDCSEVAVESGLGSLPCSMSYRMKAAWVSAR
jgi:hypothetical protein